MPKAKKQIEALLENVEERGAKRGAKRERKRVVAWLRESAHLMSQTLPEVTLEHALRTCADAIADGEHWGADAVELNVSVEPDDVPKMLDRLKDAFVGWTSDP